MARSGSNQRRLAGAVHVSLPIADANNIKRLADKEEITIASWCRRACQIALGPTPAQEEAKVVRAYRQPLPPPSEHVLEIARLREVVAELSGALVQAAIRTRESGQIDTHAQIEAALPGVRAAVRDLDALKISAMGGQR